MIEDLKQKLVQIEFDLKVGNNEIVYSLYELENEVYDSIQLEPNPRFGKVLEGLYRKIQDIKSRYDFYDQEYVLEYMFPDGEFDL